MWEEYLAQDSCVIDREPNYSFDKNLYFKEIPYERSTYWVGQSYTLTSPNNSSLPRAKSWLYNDQAGNITLKVSPSYNWHFSDPKPNEKFIPFSEFMKDYKPILKTIISKDQAQQWLKQTEDFLKIVEKNNPFT